VTRGIVQIKPKQAMRRPQKIEIPIIVIALMR
jgi:hypothetical protein